MSTYPEYDNEITQYLTDALRETVSGISSDEVDEALVELVNSLVESIPYFSNPDVRAAHEGALGVELALKLPNGSIHAAPTTSNSNGTIRNSYSYRGSYSGCQNAFFGGVQSTDAQIKLDQEVKAAAGNLNDAWWGSYAMAILSDTIRSYYSVSLNSTNLNNAMHQFNEELRPGLSPSYLAVFTEGFGPTSTAFKAIVATGKTLEAANILNASLSNPVFMTNFNYVMMAGGNSATAGEWFEFNLWVALKALGLPDLDGEITRHEAEGLVVPSQLGPGNWWTGSYHDWYVELAGAVLHSHALSTMQANFPVEHTLYYALGPGPDYSHMDENVDNGFCPSFCDWNPENPYRID